jgi:glycosyltransferase involved in cell wall biosynthesis
MYRHGRIVIALISGSTYAGGAERYLELLAAGLDAERFDTVVVTGGAPGLAGFRARIRDAGIRAEAAPGAGRMLGLLRKIRPDIVHINMPGPFECSYGLPATLARLAGVRKIITTDHLPMVEPFARARVFRSVHLPHVSRFITVSEDNRRHMTGKHGVPADRIRVVYNGIPDPGHPAGRPAGKDKVDLLIAGSLEERKGHSVLFRAMEELPGNVRLTVAGDGPLRGELESKANGRIDILGAVDDMRSLMARCDILAVPSLLEATPYVILEAMAAGKPVVASGIFGIPEQVDDGVTGLLVPPGDEAALASALKRLSADPRFMAEMGDAGRKRYEELFTLDRSIDGTVEVYDELLGESSL